MPKLTTKNLRSRLTIRRTPYYHPKPSGRSWSLGYQKRPNARSWVVRWREPTGGYRYKTLGATDDVDGGLDFDLAMSLAKERVERFETGDDATPVLTVENVLADYLDELRARGRNTATARVHIKAFIKPYWGEREVASAERDEYRQWRNHLASQPPRKRTATFSNVIDHRDVDMTDADIQRKRRSSVNRILTTFKAALNLAWENHPREIATSDEWRLGLKPFRNVDAPREQWLKIEDIRRFLNACEPDFRELVAAALYTGARYSELARAQAAHMDIQQRSLYVPLSKSGRPRTIHLNKKAVGFFTRIAAGKVGSDLLLTKSDGSEWGKAHQSRRMQLACERAEVPAMGFHQLRHSYASIAVKNGLPLQILALNLGHADTRMVERHYAHLESEYVREQIAKSTATFSFDFGGADVVTIDQKSV